MEELRTAVSQRKREGASRRAMGPVGIAQGVAFEGAQVQVHLVL